MMEEFQKIGARLVNLRRFLVARQGVPGYEKNCEAIHAEIARLEGTTLPKKIMAVPEQSKRSLTNEEIAEHLIGEANALRGTTGDSDGDDGA